MIKEEHYSDKGSLEVNQDAIFYDTDKSIAVFCVADGMGGHMHGELASRAIVDSLSAWYQAYEAKNEEIVFGEAIKSIEMVLTNVNAQIFADYNTSGRCGSTAVVLVMAKDEYAIFSAGDSRIYLKRGWGFSQLTVDDVWQNNPNNVINMSRKEIVSSEHYGKLTKAVGIKPQIVFNRTTGVLKKGDIFFLCCDGVYKFIAEKRLKKIFANPQKICDEVNKVGAPDNFSFIIVRS
ncbi:PP2C family protein-serine/threonine phosphatase [Pseudobutyrivibrio sp.]|uniref:PP2C family protein-serine/threonine phosphatase n=1 Tax=Pseudobutyrivibrio sp. TaxID=2014367 RepID=UPI001D32ECA3|nr:PP2C family serine/threonine-protein phosphatase [Pseudobutyrivibrio sp.]MBE5912010.1 serine/threonine-protein phosphatase [Pseudobutyrivibrio sp.]